jgi:hypothetical protein
MADPMTFPRILYHRDEPTGRIFETAEALHAAGAGWVQHPSELQPTPAAETPPEESSESPTPRSRR